MKYFSTLVVLFLSLAVFAQTQNQSTNSFIIKGDIKNEVQFSAADLAKYGQKEINKNDLGKYLQDVAKTNEKIQGVLLEDILSAVLLNSNSPRNFSNYNFSFLSFEGTKQTYSWNELSTGSAKEKTFIVTARDGKQIKETQEGFVVIFPLQNNKGEDYLKNLKEIIISKN